jgi:hypothetical protein
VSVLRRLTDYSDPNSWGSRIRRRRTAQLRTMIENYSRHQPGPVRIIDMGGEASYWQIFGDPWLQAHGVKIDLVNLYGEKLPTNPNPDVYSMTVADCCDLSSVPDKSYAIAHSNSVLEHLNNWRQVAKFAATARRVAISYYIQTPNFWFPIEPHFGFFGFQLLPEAVRVDLIRKRALGNYPRADSLARAYDFVQDVRLLTGSHFATLFPEALIQRERLLGLVKSVTAIYTPEVCLKASAAPGGPRNTPIDLVLA